MARESVEQLLSAFEVWSDAAGDGADHEVVEVVVTVREDFGGARDPCRWEDGDVRRLLLDVLPRKLMLQDAPAESTVSSLKSFLRFLEGSRRMHRHSAALSVLLAEVDDAAPSYAGAMVDPAKAGLAKTMVSAIRAEGVDVTDADAVQRWQERFNARPYDERVGLTGGPEPGWRPPTPVEDGPVSLPEAAADETTALPPVRLAPRTELAAAARGCVFLADVERLVGWVGERRPITGTGALRLRDVRQAAADLALLDSDSPLLENLRSAWELPEVSELWAAAEALDMLELTASRANPGPRAAVLRNGDDEDVLDAWSTAFELAAVWARVQGVSERAEAALTGMVPLTVVATYTADGPQPLAELSEILEGALGEELDAQGLPDFLVRRALRELPDLLALWERLGAAQVSDDDVVLTPLGLYGAHVLLSKIGFDAPAVGDPQEMTADELLALVGGLDVEHGSRLVDDWLAGRDAEQAAAALLRVARDCDPLQRGLVFQVLDGVGEKAAPAVRAVLEEQPLRPYAALWLNLHGLDEIPIAAEEMQWMFTDVCSGMLDAGVAESLVEQVGQFGSAEEQTQMLGQLWRSGHPRTADVLAAIGEQHPDARVAKSARKAAFKARSSR